MCSDYRVIMYFKSKIGSYIPEDLSIALRKEGYPNKVLNKEIRKIDGCYYLLVFLILTTWIGVEEIARRLGYEIY